MKKSIFLEISIWGMLVISIALAAFNFGMQAAAVDDEHTAGMTHRFEAFYEHVETYILMSIDRALESDLFEMLYKSNVSISLKGSWLSEVENVGFNTKRIVLDVSKAPSKVLVKSQVSVEGFSNVNKDPEIRKMLALKNGYVDLEEDVAFFRTNIDREEIAIIYINKEMAYKAVRHLSKEIQDIGFGNMLPSNVFIVDEQMVPINGTHPILDKQYFSGVKAVKLTTLKTKVDTELYYKPIQGTKWAILMIVDLDSGVYRDETLKSKIVNVILVFFIVGFAANLLMSVKEFKLLSMTKVELEKEVGNRTIELLKSNRTQELTLKESNRVKVELFKKNQLLEKNVKELKDAQIKLVESEKMASLGNLVAGIAHEINTPVGVCITSGSFLKGTIKNVNSSIINKTMTKKEMTKYMNELEEATDLIINNLERTSELVKSFKKVAIDQSSETVELFNLKEYIKMIIISLKHEYKPFNYKFNVICPDDLFITGFPGAYAQIFNNFILNTIKHGFDGRIDGQINFEIKSDDKFIYLRYWDDGMGISSVVKDRIFEPFVTTARQTGGSGLGMHIVYNIVTQKLDGTIELVDRREGAEFYVKIPRV